MKYNKVVFISFLVIKFMNLTSFVSHYIPCFCFNHNFLLHLFPIHLFFYLLLLFALQPLAFFSFHHNFIHSIILLFGFSSFLYRFLFSLLTALSAITKHNTSSSSQPYSLTQPFIHLPVIQPLPITNKH